MVGDGLCAYVGSQDGGRWVVYVYVGSLKPCPHYKPDSMHIQCEFTDLV